MLAAALASLAVGATAPPPARFLHVDARRHTVAVTLIAGYDSSNGGFNFDGYSRTLMWTVPRGWRVRVSCENRGAVRHSCAVVKGPVSTRPVFPGAQSPHPFLGLRRGQKAVFTFRATKAGVFRFACLVPGHEAARMYDVLEVVRRGRPKIEDLRVKH